MRVERAIGRRRWGWMVAWLLTTGSQAWAHELTLTATELAFDGRGGFRVEMVCDLAALALGAAPSADSAWLENQLRALSAAELVDRITNLQRFFERRVRLRFDGQPVPFEVSFPDAAGAGSAPESSLLGEVARLEGTIPADARELTFRASRSFPPVHLSIATPTGPRLQGVLERGVPSDAILLDTVPVATSTGGLFRTYLILGFRHILPHGIDHVLFVLGLFLLSPKVRPLLWQVSAFTVAHAVTLTLAIFEVVRLPATIVEPLIALSIVYVGLENAWTRELTPWRPLLVLAFGLLHGLGFAAVLGELGLPPGERLTGLIAFNLGIELGQLAVLALAFAALGAWRHRPWYRRRLTLPLSLAIATVALMWTVERLL